MSNIDHNKFAENFDKIFRSKPMDDSIRELDFINMCGGSGCRYQHGGGDDAFV